MCPRIESCCRRTKRRTGIRDLKHEDIKLNKAHFEEKKKRNMKQTRINGWRECLSFEQKQEKEIRRQGTSSESREEIN